MDTNMKDSGIEWIGEIPAEWTVEKGKFYFINNKYIPGIKASEYDRLALTLKGVISRSKDDADGLQPKDFNTYQLLRENELVFKLIDLQNVSTSRVGLAHSTGLVSPAYIVLHAGDKILPEYAEKFYLMMWHREIFNALGDNGVRSNLGVSDLLNVPITIPPLNVQKSIANFLDQKCSEINSLSSDIQSQIDVLEEYKKSVITEAVTKGLNPEVEMKDSGVEWIGMIPTHWDATRIKFHAEIKGRIGFRGYTEKDLVDESEGAITLSPSNFNSMMMNYNKCTYISWFKYYESPEIMINNGDILFVKTGSSYGKNCLVHDLPMEATINPQLIVFKNIKTNNEFFAYMLQSIGIRIQSDLAVFGGTIPTMSQNKISNFSFALPPINEQNEIVVHLNSICATINDAIADKRAQLETLAEYKKSLIYEYVTGKKEV